MAAPIVSRLILNTKGFTQAARGAANALKPIGAGLSAIGGLATKAAVAFTALTAATSAIIIRQTSFIARLQDTSDKLGIGVEFLQKFRYAAEQSGVSIETADMALQRFTRRVAEAARGTGEARGAIAQLGIKIKDTNGNLRPMEEILFDVADGIANTTDEAERVRLAFKFFDSEGVALVNTLNKGGDALEGMFNRAQLLGGVLSAQATQGAKDFDNALTDLSTLIGGLTNTLVASLAPALEDITLKFVSFVQSLVQEQGGFENFGNYLKDQFLTIIQKVIGAFVTMYNVVVQVFNGMVRALDFLGLGSDIANVKKNLEEFKELEGKSFLENFFDLGNWQVTTGKAKEILEKEFGSANFLLTPENVQRAIGALERGLTQLEASGATDWMLQPIAESTFMKWFEFLEQYKTATQEANAEVIEEVIVTGKKMGMTLEKLLDDIFGIERMTKFWETWDAETSGAMDKIKAIGELLFDTVSDFIKGIADKLEAAGIGDYVKTLEDGFVKAAGMFEDALADAIVKGKADFSALGDHIKQVLAKAMIQKFITGPIMGLFGLAEGGPAKAGQPYIVGEEGPELFVPKNSGTVIPNDETMDMLSGGPGVGNLGGTNVTYNINAVDALSFKQMVARDPEFIFSVTQAGRRRLPI